MPRGVSAWIAALSVALLAAWLLYLCGRPLATSDLWWHLKMGEVYATQGLWPDGDPLLHTAHAYAPIQHEWLFGVWVYAVERLSGFQGLRVLHVLLAASTLLLAFGVFRRRGRTPEWALLFTALFALLSSWRLVQLRPDLVSIPATLLLYRLLLEPDEAPGWRRIAAAVALMLVWANAHSLFAIGLLLQGAALAGCLGEAFIAARIAPGSELRPRRRAGRLAAALGLSALASLLNPRGLAQHLTFFTSSRDSAIWEIADEWRRFDPLSWRDLGHSVGPGEWLLTDLVLALFVCCALASGIALARRRSADSLRDAAPVMACLGVAGGVAALASVRFLWLGFFPLLYLLGCERRLSPGSARRAAWGAAAACALLAFAYPESNAARRYLPEAPVGARYLTPPFNEFKFHADAVRFLEQTGLEGRLFNTYRLGGYLAYRLAPRLRTFIDSRTEHYPAEVYREYGLVTQRLGARPGEGFHALLDRRGVDVFFGVGIPPTRIGRRYTSAHLEGSPDWLLVSRSIRHGIYLRRDERNRENLERVALWYRREGVPFDPARGLDVEAVLRERPEWAEEHRMAPHGYAGWLRALDDPEPERRFRARVVLARSHALLGAYERAVRLSREAALLRPDAKAPRRQLVYSLLRLSRNAEALAAAQALVDVDPDDARSLAYLTTARALHEPAPDAPPAGARIDRLTL